MIFFTKKFFWVIIALFAYFKCKCEKNCTFSNIFQKVKSYFFANSYHSPCDSCWNSKKSIKLKPPSVYPRLWCGGRTHSLGEEGGGGSIFWKMPDTALYSTFVRTLWARYLMTTQVKKEPSVDIFRNALNLCFLMSQNRFTLFEHIMWIDNQNNDFEHKFLCIGTSTFLTFFPVYIPDNFGQIQKGFMFNDICTCI